jgi:glutathione S-transferase
MVEQSVRFYPRTPLYRMLPPFGPTVLRTARRPSAGGRSLERLRADYEADLTRLDALAAGAPFLAGERPTVFDFAVWGLLRSMRGLAGEELLARRVSLAEWYERVEAIGA